METAHVPTSASLTLDTDTPDDVAATHYRALAVEGFRSLEAAEPVWRAFETSATFSPYQSYAWVHAWMTRIGVRKGYEPLIVVVSHGGRPAMLLPLGLQTIGGLTHCVFLGGEHLNCAMPLVDPAATERVTGEDIRGLLGKIQRLEPRIDLFTLLNQPLDWLGVANPLAQLPHRPSPSNAFGAELGGCYETFAQSRRSSKSLGKLRKKENKLAREVGPLSLAEPDDPAAIAETIDVFLHQRKARFAALGVTDPYQATAGRAFLEELARPVEPGAAPALRFQVLKAGETPVAIMGSLRVGDHASGFVNSMAEETYRAYSPGELLLTKLFALHCRTGVRTIDLGIGESRYKSDWCDVLPLVDSVVPITPRGKLLHMLVTAGRRLKRAVKQNERAFSLYKRLRIRIRRFW